jgi:hypothetical protein
VLHLVRHTYELSHECVAICHHIGSFESKNPALRSLINWVHISLPSKNVNLFSTVVLPVLVLGSHINRVPYLKPCQLVTGIHIASEMSL